MTYSLAIPLSGQPVYVNGGAPDDDYVTLPYALDQIMHNLVEGWGKTDRLRAISDAVYQFYRLGGDDYLEVIATHAESRGLDPDGVGAAILNGRNRWINRADEQPITQAPDGTLRQPPPGKRPAFDWKSAALKSRHLCDRRYPQMRAILPGLIPEGVMLLAARPKIGKTWMLQQVGCAVGGNHADTLGVQARQGDVMMLTLEDGERRTQARFTKYFGADSNNWPERVTVTASWRRLDQGGVDDLREWCKSVPAPTLITIDTLKRVRAPKNKSQTDYDADYDACRPLIELSHEFPGLGIVCAVHDRKAGADDVFDTVSGTLGLTGGVDAIAIIKRTAQGFTLHVEGRDLETVVEKAIDFDRETCRWQILGDVSAMPPTDTKGRVIAALNAVGQPMSIDALLKATGIPKRNTLDKALSRMTKDGDIRRTENGMYAA